jgi:quinol monooxygenase YgiN
MPRALSVLAALVLTVSPGIAQSGGDAAPETRVFAVTYVEIVPSGRATATAAFRQYRLASLADGGDIAIFEQIGRPGHFVVLERWIDQKAFDAHAGSARTRQLQSTLDPIRASHYDQRPYKMFASATAPPQKPNAQMIYAVAHVDIAPQSKGDAPGLLKQLVQDSRQEAGHIRFAVLQHAMRGNHFTIVEAWQNDKALEAHAAATHTRQYREQIGPLTGSPLDERLFRMIE